MPEALPGDVHVVRARADRTGEPHTVPQVDSRLDFKVLTADTGGSLFVLENRDMSSITQRTPGSSTSSSRRDKPRRPAPSDEAKRPDPMPAFRTATAVPSDRDGIRAASRSGQSPSASTAEQAPSVIESPSATIAASGRDARTCTS